MSTLEIRESDVRLPRLGSEGFAIPGDTLKGTVVSTPEPDKHTVESFRRFYTHLPRSEDQSLVLLKVHLLVEEQIRAFVDERMHRPVALYAARLTFHQIACLAEALCTDDIHLNVWSAVKKLNQMRNDIAHKLEPKSVEGQLREFCILIGVPARTEAKGNELMADFTFAAMALHSEIAIFARRRPTGILKLVPTTS